MSRHATDVQESAPSPPLPADHVLGSGAVLFPGAFDQHGCPLIMFPVDGQDKLSSELSKAQVVDFMNYFLRLHNKKQAKESLLSVVADLRQASPATTRFIADTLLLLELHKRTVHSVYVIQPKKKDMVKLLLKHLVPPKPHTASFKKVLLKEISELSNHIDRSQLPAELGGYLIYCHQSWVAFIKEIDAFVQEFLCVVQRLPECISTLRALSRLPMPSAFTELQHFCSNNQATFQQLRRELGLDELLRHCECVLEKLRSPETEPCYLDMAGTALYTRTSHDMMHNHSRITSAVEKVELLWQQAFSTAHLQLQVLQLREDALQITEQIKTLFQEKLEPYQMEIAKDDAKAVMLESEFEASIYTPAMALVRSAEDVIHTSAEMLPYDAHTGEHWALDLERLKDKLHSAVHFILQTLGAVSNYHHFYNKASGWYTLALFENFLQELLSGLNAESTQRRSGGAAPAWKHKISTFLKKNPPPDTEELVHLVNLSSAIPVEEVQQAGTQMAQRCMTLRKLLVSSGPVAVAELQLALQWQYQFFRSSNGNASPAGSATNTKAEDVPEHSSKHKSRKQDAAHPRPTSTTAACGMLSAEGKPISLSSFDSGFDGAGTSPLEAWAGRDKVDGLSRLAENKDSMGPDLSQPQTHKDNISTLFDCEDHREEFGFLGGSSRASVHTLPKPTAQPIGFDVQVKRSAALPTNPWLSLPVDDLENSYKVTVTQNPTLQKRDPQFHDPLDPYANAEQFDRCGDEPRQTSVLSSPQARELQTRDWLLHSHCTLEDSELSPTDNMLSSTLTDGRDKSVCATEDDPTLLWDSYDLRDHNQDPVHSLIDISMEDWDLKEQEGLREVEKVLERADEILEKEEDVVAQEAVLEALLCSEDRLHQWPQWDSEQQHTGMSSSELAEAGVLGLDDNLIPAESDDLSEPRSTGSPIETEFWEWHNPSTEATPEAEDAVSFPSRPGLVTELREVQVLDQLIMEENLKIHELRRCVEEGPNEDHLSRGKALDPNGLLKMSKEREAFRVQLEKEKREVKKLEKSLDKEHDKKHKNRARKVVKCSIMEKTSTKNEEVSAQCVAIVSGSCNESQTTNSYAEGICETKHIQAVWGPNVAQEATIQQDLIQLPDSQCLQDHCSEARPTVFNRTTLISASDFTEALKEKVTEPQGYIYGRELDGSGGEKNATICKPEASLSPETRPDDGAFDPGGESLQVPPQPKPRKALFLVNKIVSKQETPHSEQQNPALSPLPTFVQFDLQNEPSSELPENLTPAISTNLDLNPNANEHSTNNNNNYALSELSLSESSSTDEEDTWVAPAFLRQAHSPPPEEIQADMRANEGQDPLPAPELPPEFGRDEQNEEDWSDGGVHSSLAMRRSGSGAPGPQAQLNNNTREVTDFKTPIVLDTGSGLMKAGFADQDLPNIIYPTIIGMPKYEEVMNGSFERETYIGHEAQHMRGVLALKRPIKNGIIRNWDEMEKIWTHTFQQLRVEPEDHPVLLTEAAMNPLDNRRRTVEIMFECFNVPFTYVAMQAVLALYASGRATGVVFDSGDGVSHSVPVFEGYSLPHAVQRFPLAGVDVTMHLKKLLQESGVSMRTTAELEIVREMKEQCCCVALDYEAELSGGAAATREMYYTMPDGQIVNLHTERFRAPEILFKPELIGRDHYGMHESLFKSILCSDIDLRRCLLGNIVLSGGNTQLAGLPERLQDEMVGLAGEMGESVRVSSPQHRDFSVWRGGAALANLPSFSSAWISQEEYDEIGPDIVFRKCF